MIKPTTTSPLLFVFLLAFVVNVIVAIWTLTVSLRSPLIFLNLPTSTASSTYCPGDIVPYTFTVQVRDNVELTYDLVPMNDHIPSSQSITEYILLHGDVVLTLDKEWRIPFFYPGVTGDLVWQPGEYRRRVKVKSQEGELVDIGFSFSIGEECFER